MDDEMTDVSYKVGQILYVVDGTSMRITPVQVIEEVSKKTITGTHVSYIVELPGANGQKSKIDVSEINREIFQNPKKLKEILIKRASEAINNIVLTAVMSAEREFSAGTKTQSKEVLEIKQEVVKAQQTSDNIVKVKMPDGSIVTAKL